MDAFQPMRVELPLDALEDIGGTYSMLKLASLKAAEIHTDRDCEAARWFTFPTYSLSPISTRFSASTPANKHSTR